MASEAHDREEPSSKFCFSVKIDDRKVLFQEAHGLDTEAEVIEYRAGNEKTFSTIKMPGIRKFGNVTLKKGVVANDGALYDWYESIEMNVIKRSTVTISLLDQSGAPSMAWTLTHAWPTKISGIDLKGDGNEIAIEVLELAHEGLAISKA